MSTLKKIPIVFPAGIPLVPMIWAIKKYKDFYKSILAVFGFELY